MAEIDFFSLSHFLSASCRRCVCVWSIFLNSTNKKHEKESGVVTHLSVKLPPTLLCSPLLPPCCFTTVFVPFFCHLPRNIKPLLKLPKGNQMRGAFFQRARPDCSSELTLSQVCANQGEDINRLGLRLFPWRRISGIYFPVVRPHFPLCPPPLPLPPLPFSAPGGIAWAAFLQRLCFCALSRPPASLQELCRTWHRAFRRDGTDWAEPLHTWTSGRATFF